METVSAEVLVNGKPVRKYSHNDSTYIEARNGSEYSIRLTNHHYERVLAVLTVDGVNTITGKPGDYNDAGWVLDPWQTIDVPGWKLNAKKVAKFQFTSRDGTYAAKMKADTSNIGVIGVAVFHKKFNNPFILMSNTTVNSTDFVTLPAVHDGTAMSGDSPTIRLDMFDTGSSAETTVVVSNTSGTSTNVNSVVSSGTRSRRKKVEGEEKTSATLGTAFGRGVEYSTESVSFERSTPDPVQLLVINYKHGKALKKLGIDLKPKPKTHVRKTEPSPFPRNDGCPPPPGWSG